MSAPTPVRVVSFDPSRAAHREGFRALNLAWIERHFAVEPRDREELDDPEGHILARGGRVLVAERDEGAEPRVVGTVALLRGHDDEWELAKMAVDESVRGAGIGRALGEAAIAQARALGARRVSLLSNTALGPAIALYRALGFVEVPLPASEYARANIAMELLL